MKNVKIYILITLATLLILISLSLIFAPRPIEIKTIEVKFIAGGDPGFDINGSLLTFGRIPLDSTGMRTIIIRNDHSFNVEIKTFVSKDIAKFVSTNSSIFLRVGENATIPVTVYIPRDVKEGNYSGELRLLTYKER